MDGETIRTITTAGAAVLAGFGGAGIAGWFNRRNTKDSIAAAQATATAQWEQARSSEHNQWLRDRKIDVYTDYLSQVHALELAIAEYQKGYRKPDATPIPDLSRNLSNLSLRLIAPLSVQDAINEVVQTVATIMRAMTIEDAGERERLHQAAVDVFNGKSSRAVELIRMDLGTD